MTGRNDGRPKWRDDRVWQAGFLIGSALGAAATVAGRRAEKAARRGLVDWPEVERIAIGAPARAPGTLDAAELRAAEPAYAEAMARIVPALSAALGSPLPGVVERAGVVDRAGWVRANTGSFASLMSKLETDLLDQVIPPGGGLAKATMALANRWVTTRQLGFLLGFMGTRVLGQYDLALLSAEAAPGRLLFVEENIRATARTLGVPIGPFRTWIALHETTHAFEFEAHPWLRPYLAERLERQLTLFGRDARGLGREALRGLGRSIRGEGGGEHWIEAMMGPEQKALFREVQAVMSLLEGFSDYVMDEVGRDLVPDVAQISARFHERRTKRTAFERAMLRLTGHGPQDGAVQEGRAVRARDRRPPRLGGAGAPVGGPADAATRRRDRCARALDRARPRRIAGVTEPVIARAGPGSGPGGAPTAIALSPILSARYRARDLERIRAAAPGARIVTVSVEGLADASLDDVEVMLRGWLSSEAFDRILVRAPRLSWVHSATSGVERALTPAARERGIVVTNARGVFSRPIAEYVLMMILAVSRRLPQLLELQRERTWQPLEGAELRDVTVGIVGLGSIGRAVGALATAFGCRVVAVRRRGDAGTAASGPDDEGRALGELMLARVGGPETLPELLAESDFIVLAAPLTPETEEMINAETLALVKPGAWLINVARGRLDRRAGPPPRAARRRPRRRRARHVPRRAAPADVAVLRPAQRHRHAAHRVVERPRPRPQRRALLRQPAPLRERRAAAQRGRSERRVLIPATIHRCRSPSSGLPDRARPPSSTR